MTILIAGASFPKLVVCDVAKPYSELITFGVLTLIGIRATRAVVAVLTISAASASANEPPPACELHIFPVRAISVNDVTSNNMGGLIPGLINSAFSVRRPDEIAQFMRAAVPREDELQIIRSIDFATTAKGQGMRTVVHDDPYAGVNLDFNVYKRSPPIVGAPPSCYRELVLAGFYYEKGTMHKSIKTSYFYREFIDGRQSKKAKFAAEGSGVRNFPPANEGEAEAARKSVRAAYTANLMAILNGR